MEITGRLTADATATTTKTGKEVVNFNIAINDSYKSKGSSEATQLTTYVNCAYWQHVKAAEWLKKGVLVQLYGRIGMNVYTNMQGKAVGSLTFHVNDIKVLAFPKRDAGSEANTGNYNPKAQQAQKPAAADDLPF